MKKALYIVALMFVYQFGAANTLDNTVFKGSLAKVIDENETVWIKTSMGQMVSEGTVLYVHDNESDTTTAILKVQEVLTRYIVASVIDSLPEAKLSVGDKVNNVYRWDAYEYRVEIAYKKGKKAVVVVDDIIIDNSLSATSYGYKALNIDGTLIKSMKLSISSDELNVSRIYFKDKKVIIVRKANIASLKRLSDKKVLYNSRSGQVVPRRIGTFKDSKGYILFSKEHMQSIRIIKRLKGAKVVYNYDSAAVPKLNGDKKYKVRFSLYDIGLGIRALESRISEEDDAAIVSKLAQNIRLYNKDNIAWIGVAGSFNGWDENKNLMTQNTDGIYESSIELTKGTYEYYFVIALKGSDNILLGATDPYSNRIKKIVDIDFDIDDTASKPGAEEEGDSNDGLVEGEAIGGGINRFEFIFGNSGRVSVIDVPGTTLEKEAVVKHKKVSEKPKKIKQKALSYNANEIALEEEKISKHYAKDNKVIIGGVAHYVVTFTFNQLNLVPLDIKRKVNEEETKDKPSYDRISKLKKNLSFYDEDKIDSVSIVGEFGTHAMYKEKDGSWKVKLFLAQGEHWYKFAVTSIEYGDKPYLIDYVFTTEAGKDNLGNPANVIRIE